MMPNRTVCAMLEEIRVMYKTRNFSGLLGHVEEIQAACNRMEAGLGDKHDMERYRRLAKEYREKYRKFKKKSGEEVSEYD